ncbi:MAG: DUF4351 domain-containing protein [Scytonema sp. RU_4_4]|nr:DUF4351 domain-containing protein [Scytonema sp. RU_4_4]
MRESPLYQEILQEGVQRGLHQGKLDTVLLLLNNRIGTITLDLQAQLQKLSITQLDDLCRVLLSFSSTTDLVSHLATNPVRNVELNLLLRQDIMRESPLYQEIMQQGKLELIIRQLQRRFGHIEPILQSKIQQLSSYPLEELGEALLDFSSKQDLVTWLQNY